VIHAAGTVALTLCLTVAGCGVAPTSDAGRAPTRLGGAPATFATIRRDANWSDGTPITAADFAWEWRRLSGHDPEYAAFSTTGYDRTASVTGSNGGKTVTVVFAKPFANWRELFSSGTPLLPAHYIDRLAADPHAAFNSGLATHHPTVVGGPYRVAAYQPNVSVTVGADPQATPRMLPAVWQARRARWSPGTMG
jgi:peptide/nickel transport system substrate-binding protein